MSNQRDFRTYYYFQLGMKGVNLKNIDSLLNETIIDVSKVKEFCTRTKIPTHYRSILWKVLVGVYSQYRESWAFVYQQFKDQFTDLSETVQVIEPSKQGDQTQCERLLHLFLIERQFNQNLMDKQDSLPLDVKHEHDLLLAMMNVFLSVCQQATTLEGGSFDKMEPNPNMDAYWLFSTFMNKNFGLNGANWRNNILWLVHELCRLISNLEPQIYTQVVLPYKDEVEEIFAVWFAGLFSSYLPVHITQRLWDSIMVFPFEYIPYIGLAFIKSLNQKLLSANDVSQITKILTQLQECDSDNIVYNSIALYQQQQKNMS
jgi:hypothetical protein